MVLFCLRKSTQHSRDKAYTIFLNCKDAKGRCPTFVIVQVDRQRQFARLGPLTIQDYGMDIQGTICVPHDPVPRTDKPSINFRCVKKPKYSAVKAQAYAPSPTDWEHTDDARMRCRVPQAMDNSYIAALTVTWRGDDNNSIGKEFSCVIIICVVPDVTLQRWVCCPMIQEDTNGSLGMLPRYEESDNYRNFSDTAVPEEWNYSRLVTAEHVLTVAVPSWIKCELNGEGQVDVAVVIESSKKSTSKEGKISSRDVAASLTGVISPEKRHWVRYPRPVNVQETSNRDIQMQKPPEKGRMVTRSKDVKPLDVKKKSKIETLVQPKQKVPDEIRVVTRPKTNSLTPLNDEARLNIEIPTGLKQKAPEETSVVTRPRKNYLTPLNHIAKPGSEILVRSKQKVPGKPRDTRAGELRSSNFIAKPTSGMQTQPKQGATVLRRGKYFQNHQKIVQLMKNSKTKMCLHCRPATKNEIGISFRERRPSSETIRKT